MNVDEHSYISVSMDGSGSLDMCVRCEEDENLKKCDYGPWVQELTIETDAYIRF